VSAVVRAGPAINVHGTAVLVADKGVLITGPSGSGKSTLALALIDRLGTRGRFCRLVADDQVFANGHGGRLVCHAPDTISGLAEVCGIGPQRLAASEDGAVIDLMVRLVPDTELPRLQEEAHETVAGCVVPRIDLPARNVVCALQILAAWLKLPPFRAE
jgi:serine kinase of HPr protein (carbohydrate metabolism regulator)